MIPFNKPYLTGKEAHYLYQAVYSGKLSGNGQYTKACQKFFEDQYGFEKSLLTTSCTDALEMAALLLRIESGDEVIVPSYTFVSTAVAFVRQGARIRFCDSRPDHPGMDESQIESLITPRTKAIVVVHYAGVACDMDPILALARKHNLAVVEDAAQAVDAFYKGRPLGGLGNLGCFSFHETKNVISGEGGLLAINRREYSERAEILWEKGTNRASFFRGEVNKYGWVDIGSSFLPAETVSAFLFAQLENLRSIQARRSEIWNRYQERLAPLEAKGLFRCPHIPSFASNNAHMFYLILPDLATRSALIEHLKANGVLAVFHYLSLHSSPFYADKHDGRELPWSDLYSDRLVRLPLFFELADHQVDFICDQIGAFFGPQSLLHGTRV
jgi:dTDP-4-amino-4,6-dideoxygalactose transaminase